MKNLLTASKALSAVLCICVAISSCKKSSDSVVVAASATTPAAFTFKVDGAASITADSANAILYNLGGTREMDVYVFKSGAQVLEFHFAPSAGNKAANTTLGGPTNALLTYDSSPINSWDSQSGAINVTTCDTVGNKIIGDFNFIGKQYPYTGTAIKTVSEGHMYVTKVTKM